MRWKSAVAVVAGIGLIWIGYNGYRDRANHQLGQDLARRMDRQKASDPHSEVSLSQSYGMFQLSDHVIAEHEGGTWIVQTSDESAQVVFPFRPPVDGEFPAGQPPRAAAESSNPGFVGAAACQSCHQEKHSGFVHTGHHRTSGLAAASDIPGSLSPPSNQLHIDQTDLRFTMWQRDQRTFQRVDFGQWSIDVPMDAFTGSNKLGQSYLYWVGDALFQSYVSYLTDANEWIPSPGFSDRGGDYTRPVTVRCLECHMTFIERLRAPNHFDPQTAVWGISCERCHGPGREHVDFHLANPQQREAKFVVNPKDLPRERQLDICAQCHSGTFTTRTKAFAFRPGDRILDHHEPRIENAGKVGSVHTSNQLARLQQSACFQASEMTCASCHDPHQMERGDQQQFSSRCADCHQPNQCGMHDQLGERLTANCIDCHMPTGDIEEMELDTAGGRLSPPMIDHLIRVDREATDAFLNRDR
jgi:hypothetical protein